MPLMSMGRPTSCSPRLCCCAGWCTAATGGKVISRARTAAVAARPRVRERWVSIVAGMKEWRRKVEVNRDVRCWRRMNRKVMLSRIGKVEDGSPDSASSISRDETSSRGHDRRAVRRRGQDRDTASRADHYVMRKNGTDATQDRSSLAPVELATKTTSRDGTSRPSIHPDTRRQSLSRRLKLRKKVSIIRLSLRWKTAGTGTTAVYRLRSEGVNTVAALIIAVHAVVHSCYRARHALRPSAPLDAPLRYTPSRQNS